MATLIYIYLYTMKISQFPIGAAYFAFFIIFIGIVSMMQYIPNKKAAKNIANQFGKAVFLIKQAILADVYTYGARSGRFNRFKMCDLYFIDNAIIIIGYTKVFGETIYAPPLTLQKNDPSITKLNTQSPGNDVYLEIVQAKATTPLNTQIHLKGLSDYERSLFALLA